MKETYKQIVPGWLYQTSVTGKIMEYDTQYIDYYNKLDTNEYMSRIRHDFISKYCIFDSVLDVGYGNGAFLRYCLEQKHRCFGHDISGYPVPLGAKFTPDRNIQVDLVTFFDCIEHFPQENIEKILQALKCKYICISLPWCHYTEDMSKFKTWKHRKPNEHFHHFDVRGLSHLLNISGFDVIVSGSPEDIVRSNKGLKPNILTLIGTSNKGD